MATIQQQKNSRIRLKAFDRRLLDTSCEKDCKITANRTIRYSNWPYSFTELNVVSTVF